MSKSKHKGKAKSDGIGGEHGGNVFFVDEKMFHGGDRSVASPHGSIFEGTTIHGDSECFDRVGKSKKD